MKVGDVGSGVGALRGAAWCSGDGLVGLRWKDDAWRVGRCAWGERRDDVPGDCLVAGVVTLQMGILLLRSC